MEGDPKEAEHPQVPGYQTTAERRSATMCLKMAAGRGLRSGLIESSVQRGWGGGVAAWLAGTGLLCSSES